MKSFILTQADLDRLKTMTDRDPEHGRLERAGRRGAGGAGAAVSC